MNEFVTRKVLITGGTSGLGLELCKALLDNGYEVYASGRELKYNMSGNPAFHFIRIDFDDIYGIVNVISGLINKGIVFDLVINNAGVMTPDEFIRTKSGFEYAFQVNFLSHFLIDEMILTTRKDGLLTIVSITSPVYRYLKPGFRMPEVKTYRPFRTYCETKYYILLIGEYLKKRYPDNILKFMGYNPGVFSSGIYRMQRRWFKIMYRIAAPFMNNPARIARNIAQLLDNKDISGNIIYRYGKKKAYSLPPLTAKAEKFFLYCQEALNGLPR